MEPELDLINGQNISSGRIFAILTIHSKDYTYKAIAQPPNDLYYGEISSGVYFIIQLSNCYHSKSSKLLVRLLRMYAMNVELKSSSV